MLFRVLLSAVTLFGGHVLNRRPDRILQIFGLLVTVGIGYAMLSSAVFSGSEFDKLTNLFAVALSAVIGIALLSAALTWKDAKSPAAPALSASSRIAGAVVSLLGLFVTGFATMFIYSTIGPRTGNSLFFESASDSIRSGSAATASLGGEIRYNELKRAPVGPHPLRGRIVMAGKPVGGIDVELTLNGTFRSERLVTNKQGEFEISLPAGPWTLNEVSVVSWHDATEDPPKLLLMSEYEPPRDSGYYMRSHPAESPVRIELPMRADVKLPTFELHPSITVQWPAGLDFDPSKPSAAPIADVAKDAIRWSSVPGAAEYEIQLHSVEREQNSMRTQSLVSRRQSGTELPLAQLTQQPRDSTEPSEYSVRIYAFDGNGKLLSMSHAGIEDHAFRLAGETRLAEDMLHRTDAASDDQAEYLQNAERLSLISGLLEYNQLDAARAILKEVTDDAPPGRKVAMQGAIEAMSGNCAAAIPLLDQAEKEGGLGCAPSKYRSMCPSSR